MASRAFEVNDPTIRVVARYRAREPRAVRLDLGSDKLAGKPALLKRRSGGQRGALRLPPDYRSQSVSDLAADLQRAEALKQMYDAIVVGARCAGAPTAPAARPRVGAKYCWSIGQRFRATSRTAT